MAKPTCAFLAVLLTLCMVLTLLPTASVGAGSSSAVAFTPVDPSILPEDLLMEGSQVGGKRLRRMFRQTTKRSGPSSSWKTRPWWTGATPPLNLADNQAALTYSDKLMAGQEVALQRIQTQVLKGQPLDVAYRFTIGVNGIAITAPYGKLAEMERVPGVKSGVSGAAI